MGMVYTYLYIKVCICIYIYVSSAAGVERFFSERYLSVPWGKNAGTSRYRRGKMPPEKDVRNGVITSIYIYIYIVSLVRAFLYSDMHIYMIQCRSVWSIFLLVGTENIPL